MYPDKIRVKVTQKRIEKGVRSNGGWCPIGYAFRGALFLDGVAGPFVLSYLVTIGGYNGHTLAKYVPVPDSLPRVGKFIRDFDEGKLVKPTSFTYERVK